jgi:hypothetical protein
VEIALLKAARPDLDPSTEGLLRRIERLEQGTGPPQASGPVAPASPPSESDDSPAGGSGSGVSGQVRRPVARPADSTSKADAPGEQPSASPDTPGPVTGPAGRLDIEQMAKVWPSVLDQLLQTAPALAATFEGARPVEVDDDENSVTIGFPADHTFNKRKAEAPDKREQMAAALETVLGEKLRPVYSVLEGEEAGSAAEGGEDAVDHAALVEKIKSEFDAEEVG